MTTLLRRSLCWVGGTIAVLGVIGSVLYFVLGCTDQSVLLGTVGAAILGTAAVDAGVIL